MRGIKTNYIVFLIKATFHLSQFILKIKRRHHIHADHRHFQFIHIPFKIHQFVLFRSFSCIYSSSKGTFLSVCSFSIKTINSDSLVVCYRYEFLSEGLISTIFIIFLVTEFWNSFSTFVVWSTVECILRTTLTFSKSLWFRSLFPYS